LTINSSAPELSFIIPVFNEEDNIRTLLNRVLNVLSKLPCSCEIILVNDGSTDKSEQLLITAASEDSRIKVVLLSRNYGHQVAVSAGMAYAKCTEAAFILDGDLQDPPEMAEAFLTQLRSGYDVVYGVRKNRKEAWYKRFAYFIAYRIIQSISATQMPLDSGDYAMISRRVLDEMNAMPEQKRYLRGLRAWVGFRQCGFEYEREARYAGTSKYSFKMLLDLAFEGIFNFSDFPIRLIRILGTWSLLICSIYSVYLIYQYIFLDSVPQGFATIILFMFFLNGVQFLAISVVGEFAARGLVEARKRPLFIVRETFNL